MKLYYVPQTRATRARWLLEEIGEPYELVRLDVAAKDNRTPEYLALNPLGQVPTLVDGDTVVFETAAVCLYLADRFPEKHLAPPPGSPDRGPYYQWNVYVPATIEPALVQYFEHNARLPEDERVAWIAEKMHRRLREVFTSLQKILEGREYLVGDGFTAADVMMASALGWARLTGLLTDLPACEAYARRMMSRDAARRARKD